MISKTKPVRKINYNGQEIPLNIVLKEETVTPSEDVQVLEPTGNYQGFSKVTVNRIPEEYAKPSGEITITEQGTFDVKDYETAVVTAPFDKKFMQLNDGTLTEVTEEDLKGATALRPYAFYNQKYLTKVELPDTILSIGSYAFNNSSLATVKLPSDLRTINDQAFSYCRITDLQIPDSVTSIGQFAFRNSPNLVSLRLPASNITALGRGWAMVCTGLKSLFIPKNYETSEYEAFSQCSSLESIVFEEGSKFRVFGQSVFQGAKISEITIPETVQSFASVAFSGCSYLKKNDNKQSLYNGFRCSYISKR